MALNTKFSVVDYMKDNKQDSSYGNRAKLAGQYGINNYSGTAQQNTKLLGYLNKPQQVATAPISRVQPQSQPQSQAKANPQTQSSGGGGYSLAEIDANKYRTESASIQDIAKKYGIDFSRQGAATQAEAEAQAKKDAANQGMRASDSRVEGSAEALDRNYFQQFMQQSQQQTNNGLNAGIASDQDLRMAMSRQAEMGDIYRDNNLEQQRLQDALGRVEQERLAREDGLSFDRSMAGAGLAQNQDQRTQQENMAMLQAAQSQRGQNIGMNQFDRNLTENQRQFGVGQDNWETEFDRLLGRDKRGDMVDDRNFNWGKESYWNDFNNINATNKANLGEQAASRRQSAANAAAGRASSAANAAASRAASRYEFDNLSGYQQASLAKEAEKASQAEEKRIKYERKDNWNAFLDKNNKFNLGGR